MNPAASEVQPEVVSWLRSKGRTLKLIKEMTGVTLPPGSLLPGVGRCWAGVGKTLDVYLKITTQKLGGNLK